MPAGRAASGRSDWPSWPLAMGAGLVAGRRRGVAASAGTATRAVGAASRTRSGCAGPAEPPTRARSARPPPAWRRTAPRARRPPSQLRRRTNFDCFYVYPTVSREPGDNANLTIQPAEAGAAVVQASQFSQCATSGRRCTAKSPRQAADGRRFKPSGDRHGVQQSFVGMEGLPRPRQPWAARRLHRALPGCRHADQAPARPGRPVPDAAQAHGVGPHPRRQRAGAAGRRRRWHLPQHPCVPFRLVRPGASSPTRASASTPPADALFGRPGQGVSLQSGQTTKGQQVVCVNPATFSAQAGALEPYFISSASNGRSLGVTTPWVTFPGLYTAQCEQRAVPPGCRSRRRPRPVTLAPPSPTHSGPLGLPPPGRQPRTGQPRCRRGEPGSRLSLSPAGRISLPRESFMAAVLDSRDGQSLAVANQKGGVAKTTTVQSLGVALARTGTSCPCGGPRSPSVPHLLPRL